MVEKQLLFTKRLEESQSPRCGYHQSSHWLLALDMSSHTYIKNLKLTLTGFLEGLKYTSSWGLELDMKDGKGRRE